MNDVASASSSPISLYHVSTSECYIHQHNKEKEKEGGLNKISFRLWLISSILFNDKMKTNLDLKLKTEKRKKIVLRSVLSYNK